MFFLLAASSFFTILLYFQIQVTQPGINRNKSISASQPVFLRTDSCLSSASSKKRSPSQSPQPTVNIAPSEDDLVYQMGSHGRSPGQFTNPQVKMNLNI